MKRCVIVVVLLLVIATSAYAAEETKEIWTPVYTWSNANEITGLHVLFNVNTEMINVTQCPWGISWNCTKTNTKRPMYFNVFAKSADNLGLMEKICSVKAPSKGKNRAYMNGRCYLNISSVYSIWEVTIYKITYTKK